MRKQHGSGGGGDDGGGNHDDDGNRAKIAEITDTTILNVTDIVAAKANGTCYIRRTLTVNYNHLLAVISVATYEGSRRNGPCGQLIPIPSLACRSANRPAKEPIVLGAFDD